MNLFSTFSLYLTKRFLLSIGGVFLASFLLVLIVDFVEMLRRIGDAPGVSSFIIFLLTLSRVPVFIEIILPFAVLIGSILCFVGLSSKLELVVARAAGISAWQFLKPAFISALLIGIFAATIYNPAAIALREYGLNKETQFFGAKTTLKSEDFWLRQASDKGQAVLSAKLATQQGQVLAGVTIYRYDENGQFFERIDAEQAIYQDKQWLLKKARITPLEKQPFEQEMYFLPTALDFEQLRESFVLPDMLSFWELPAFIALTKNAGLSAARFELQYQVLLARPLLLLAMVLLAASASLKFFRLGGMVSTIITGIVTGFLLYIISELAGNLGRSGLVPAFIAAWSPGLFGSLIGLLWLMKLEDT
jgi:lipopolysaccharide export system permease protein